MTLALVDGKKFEDRVLIHEGEWSCPECAFRRTFGTKQGALMGATDHLRTAHGLRLSLPRSS